ncbi:MAG: hypothetical protein K2G39_01160 [Lachnospiraceae bacterium]|nr:hypothetical protein [Lachnospiraceae bacterium]
MASAGGTYFIFARLWRKIGNFTYRMVRYQGNPAWMPLGSVHVRFEIPISILLVKSDLKTRLAKIK